MQRRQIGSLDVSVVGLGCNNFGARLDATATAIVVHAALDAGIDFFDTATIYGGGRSEEFLGRALRGCRDHAIIASKFGHSSEGVERTRPEYVHRAVDASLSRLGAEHIDLYQVHEPIAGVPIADTLGALNELVRTGKIREIGCSNFSAVQLREAAGAVVPGAARFVSIQNEYSLLQREPEREVLAECARLGVAFLPYFPLANGLLTGKYHKGKPAPPGTRLAAGGKATLLTDENLDRVEALATVAEASRHTLLELAVSWLLVHPAVASVIAGATSADQARANAAAASWRLDPATLANIDAAVA